MRKKIPSSIRLECTSWITGYIKSGMDKTLNLKKITNNHNQKKKEKWRKGKKMREKCRRNEIERIKLILWCLDNFNISLLYYYIIVGLYYFIIASSFNYCIIEDFPMRKISVQPYILITAGVMQERYVSIYISLLIYNFCINILYIL